MGFFDKFKKKAIDFGKAVLEQIDEFEFRAR